MISAKTIVHAEQFGFVDTQMFTPNEFFLFQKWIDPAIRFRGIYDAATLVWVLRAIHQELYGKPVPRR